MTFSILLHPGPQKNVPQHFSMEVITFHFLGLNFSIPVLGFMKYGVILNANMHEMV